MRLAAVPLCFHRDPEEAIERSGESSRTTHQAPTAIDACRYFGGLIWGAVAGVEESDLLQSRYSPIPGHWDHYPLDGEIDEAAKGSFLRRNPPEIKGTGFAVRSLAAALRNELGSPGRISKEHCDFLSLPT